MKPLIEWVEEIFTSKFGSMDQFGWFMHFLLSSSRAQHDASNSPAGKRPWVEGYPMVDESRKVSLGSGEAQQSGYSSLLFGDRDRYSRLSHSTERVPAALFMFF